MSRKTVINFAAFIALVGAGIFLFFNQMNTKSRSVTLTFVAEADGEPLIFDEFAYTNPGGAGLFRVRDFRVYISNIVLTGGGKTHVAEDSYHLLKFDRNTARSSVTLPDVSLKRISQIEFSIGIDEAANGSIESRGDLDPNNRMAWNWNIGYKFLLVEGAIQVNGAVEPLVYHIGFNENRRDLTFSRPPVIEDVDGEPMLFLIDVMKLFTGAEVIDMAELQTVKMDRSDAERLAVNYGSMIEQGWSDQR